MPGNTSCTSNHRSLLAASHMSGFDVQCNCYYIIHTISSYISTAPYVQTHTHIGTMLSRVAVGAKHMYNSH